MLYILFQAVDHMDIYTMERIHKNPVEFGVFSCLALYFPLDPCLYL